MKVFNTLKVSACYGHSKVKIYDLFGFNHWLERWSQLTEILNRTKNGELFLTDEVDVFIDHIFSSFLELPDPFHLLLHLLRLAARSTHPTNSGYSPIIMQFGLQIYLRNRSAYRSLSEILPLPSKKTLKSHLGRTGEVGTDKEFRTMFSDIINSLSGKC